MVNDEVILIQEGLEKLEDELRGLKMVKCKELVECLKFVISYGDLKENSEYYLVKDDQVFMEICILILEKMLIKVRVISLDNIDFNKVSIGLIVLLNDIEFVEKIEY